MNSFFTESIDLNNHPVRNSRKATRVKYFSALAYIVSEVSQQSEYRSFIIKRLGYYKQFLFGDINDLVKFELRDVKKFFGTFFQNTLKNMFLCDVYLILLDEPLIAKAVHIIDGYVSTRVQNALNQVAIYLSNDEEIDKKYSAVESFIAQYRLNSQFSETNTRRIIVTANMSAGKSTLINAIIGKKAARTSQEVCTGNICRFYNKPFEDGCVSLSSETLRARNLMATNGKRLCLQLHILRQASDKTQERYALSIRPA